MLRSCMELMAMLSPSTPMLMVPDMVHTPTWDKMFTIPSMQSIHTELKLSVMARGLLMLPSCMELMAMLPPSTMVAALTLMMLATPPLTPTDTLPTLLLWWLPLC